MTIYNTRNRSNDTASQKEKKICFNAHAGGKWNLTVQCLSKQNMVIKKLSDVKVWE